MNKKIWLTGALCIAAIFITVFVYNNFIMDKDAAEARRAEEQAAAEALLPDDYSVRSADFEPVGESAASVQDYSNELFTVEFSAAGGVVSSLKLNEYESETGGPVELVFSGGSGIYPFSLYDGGYESPVIDGHFNGIRSGDDVIFTGRFADENGSIFEIRKVWSFKPRSYLIGFRIEIEASGGDLPLGDGEFLYSLGFGPQLGPEFDKLDRGYVYRYFCLYDEGEKRNLGTPEEEKILELDNTYPWLGIESRYFTSVTIPELESYTPAWDERNTAGIFKRNAFFIQRPDDGIGSVSDQYYVYFGPKDAEILGSLDGFELGVLTGDGGVVAILSKIMKTVLGMLYRFIPNYGLDIILFVLIIQLIIFPVSRRTYDNAIRMQLLGPEIADIKKRLKYNDRKMNEETMNLFKEKGVKPRSSMLPFIIHLPFFILTYVILLTDIDFRLATFIPGWINDIASPEYILDIAPAQIPVTAWDKIRLLPIIALAVSLLQSRYIQAPADSIRSMRIMSYLVPVVMFIVIYNMPSGAVLFWLTMTATNLLIQWRIKARYADKK
ncbi:MAG: YidC/Oxa1 family insertase periplasmic-domain containing protein [Spirochaetales bacterium]|uniref:Membrane protein insertase YidC n=1 Tax=Candidatus Thalassospirochaeta sargassi TaxID=3119039 RepID=A0AAJ1ICZ7_9SPIO|nr:YidC/Oxa1 family insertase periplasmic-domain containing protein [Spirochaetales bacterium]